MAEPSSVSSDVAFSAAVKAVQQRKGSRAAYARMEQGGGWPQTISDELKREIEAQTSVFLATASAQGQPYVQHRGGPPGFLRVLDEQTIGLVDFAGNRQYITQGNLSENPRAQLFLIDYAQRRRFKLWGTARVVEGDEALTRQLMPTGYRARPEQVLLFTLSAWDANCPQHIPQRWDAAAVAEVVQAQVAAQAKEQVAAQLEQKLAAALLAKELRIAALEAELAQLRR